MDSMIQAIKDVFATMTVLGWLPLPMAVSVVAMFGLRIAFEASVLDVNTAEGLAIRGRTKMLIFAAVAFITALVQYGLQKPASGFERALALGFTMADVMFAYVITSSEKVKGLVKNQFANQQGTDGSPKP